MFPYLTEGKCPLGTEYVEIGEISYQRHLPLVLFSHLIDNRKMWEESLVCTWTSNSLLTGSPSFNHLTLAGYTKENVPLDLLYHFDCIHSCMQLNALPI